MRSHLLLREARHRAGLSQAELAERAGKSVSAISRWERAGVEPSVRMLQDLVRAAGFDLVVGLATADEHDLTLVRRSLTRTPQERLSEMVQAVRALQAMAASVG